MTIMLHTCCAPCLSGSRHYFMEEGVDYTVFWYNPNIYNEDELNKRYNTLLEFGKDIGSSIISGCGMSNDDYRKMIECYLSDGTVPEDLGRILRSRCDICYYIRMRACAIMAKEKGSEGFSTTLLLSRYQKHDRIRSVGESIENEMDIDFFYTDLRRYWNRSLDESRRFRLYRQRYCGCEPSLKESIARIDQKGPKTP